MQAVTPTNNLVPTRVAKMKRRSDSSQKITAFFSSPPPAKRTTGVEGGDTLSASTSNDRNRDPEPKYPFIARVLMERNTRQATTEDGSQITRGCFTSMMRACTVRSAVSSTRRTGRTSRRCGTLSLAPPYARTYLLGTKLRRCTRKP